MTNMYHDTTEMCHLGGRIHRWEHDPPRRLGGGSATCCATTCSEARMFFFGGAGGGGSSFFGGPCLRKTPWRPNSKRRGKAGSHYLYQHIYVGYTRDVFTCGETDILREESLILMWGVLPLYSRSG